MIYVFRNDELALHDCVSWIYLLIVFGNIPLPMTVLLNTVSSGRTGDRNFCISCSQTLQLDKSVFNSRRMSLPTRVYHLPRCEVLLWFYHALYLWNHIDMFHFSKIFIPTLPLATKILKLQWGVKNKVVTLLSFWGLKDAPWWDDSKSGLRIKIEWHLPLFWPKNGRKLAKCTI